MTTAPRGARLAQLLLLLRTTAPSPLAPSSLGDVCGMAVRGCPLLDDADPVVIAGIGDSGTRAVRSLVHEFGGVAMCARDEGSSSHDATQFRVAGYESQIREFLAISRSLDYNESSLGREAWAATRAVACGGLARYAECMCPRGHVAARARSRAGAGACVLGARVACDSGLWGWKTPKSLYYLPVLDDIFAARAAARPVAAARGVAPSPPPRGVGRAAGVRFVHVVRDGRDVAYGQFNQIGFARQFFGADAVTRRGRARRALRGLGKHRTDSGEGATSRASARAARKKERHGAARRDADADAVVAATVAGGGSALNASGAPAKHAHEAHMNARRARARVRFWSELNVDLFCYGARALAPSGRYFVVRIEDLALRPHALTDAAAVARALGTFAGVAAARDARAIADAVAIFEGHASAFGGGRLAADERAHRLEALGSGGTRALALFGYALGEYGIAARCADLGACGIVAPAARATARCGERDPE